MKTALARKPVIETNRGEALLSLLRSVGWQDAVLTPLKADASFRRYIRLNRDDETAMLMDAPPEKETVIPYVSVARHLRGQGYSAPQVLAANEGMGFVLCEDLGDELYNRILRQDEKKEEELYEAAVSLLAKWYQSPALLKEEGAAKLPVPEYHHSELMREVGIFAQWYLPEVLPGEADKLSKTFLEVWQTLLSEYPPACEVLVHRDYHADNLLWLNHREGHERVGLLDFQDALWGDPAYDLVSLLEDARRDVSEEIVERCKRLYLTQTGMDSERFERHFALLGAQRNCKIIGIFVRLARRDGKKHYLSLLPRVWRYLQQDLQHPALTPLNQWMQQHVPMSARGEIVIHG